MRRHNLNPPYYPRSMLRSGRFNGSTSSCTIQTILVMVRPSAIQEVSSTPPNRGTAEHWVSRRVMPLMPTTKSTFMLELHLELGLLFRLLLVCLSKAPCKHAGGIISAAGQAFAASGKYMLISEESRHARIFLAINAILALRHNYRTNEYTPIAGRGWLTRSVAIPAGNLSSSSRRGCTCRSCQRTRSAQDRNKSTPFLRCCGEFTRHRRRSGRPRK